MSTLEMANPAHHEFQTFLAGAAGVSAAVRRELAERVGLELSTACAVRRLRYVGLDVRWAMEQAHRHDRAPVPICLDAIMMRRTVVFAVIGRNTEGRIGALDVARRPWLRKRVPDAAAVVERELLQSLVDNQLAGGTAYWYVEGEPGDAENLVRGEEAGQGDALFRSLLRQKATVRYFKDAASLGALVIRDGLDELDRRHPVPDATSVAAEEHGAHEAFAAARGRTYVKIGDYAGRLDSFVDQRAEQGRLALLTGLPGCGKSTLLAHWAADYRLRHREDIVVEYYVGVAPSCPSWGDLLRHVLAAIRERQGVTEPLPGDDAGLAAAFQRWPAYCAPRRVVIVIDGLDRLATGSQGLEWLSAAALPPNVRLVLSSVESGDAYAEAFERADEVIRMEPLTPDDRWKILQAYLARGRRLSDAQARALARTPGVSTPLFLRTILEALPADGALRDLGQQLRSYLESASLDELFRKVLAAIESEKGYRGRLLERIVTSIWSARDGLSEKELLGITGAAADRLRAVLDRLGAFLVTHNGLYRFFHDQLADAVARRYLVESGKRRKSHELLARYFRDADFTERTARELPWQWEQAGRWSELRRCVAGPVLACELSRAEHRNDLLRYWRVMAGGGNLAEAYLDAIGNTRPPLAIEERIEAHLRLGDAFNDAAMYAEAETVLGAVLLHPADRTPVPRAHLLLSRTRQARGDFDGAEGLLLAVTGGDAGCPDELLVEALESLGLLYYTRHKYDAAAPVLARALALCSELRGSENPTRLGILSTMAAVAHARGNYHAVEHLFSMLLNAVRRVHGEKHPATSSALSNLAAALRELDRVPEAIELVERAVEIDTELFGRLHPETGLKLNNLGTLLRLARQYPAAESALLESRSILLAAYGDIHPDVASCRNNLATLYSNMPEHYTDAEAEFVEVIRLRTIMFGADAVITVNTELNLGWLLAKRGRFSEAIAIYERVLPLKERALGRNHPKALQSRRNYERILAAARGERGLEDGEV